MGSYRYRIGRAGDEFKGSLVTSPFAVYALIEPRYLLVWVRQQGLIQYNDACAAIFQRAIVNGLKWKGSGFSCTAVSAHSEPGFRLIIARFCF